MERQVQRAAAPGRLKCRHKVPGVSPLGYSGRVYCKQPATHFVCWPMTGRGGARVLAKSERCELHARYWADRYRLEMPK